MKKAPKDYLLHACVYINRGKERGAKAAMAKHFGLSRVAISNWFKNGVPADQVDKVCEACDDTVTRNQLRPDLFRPDKLAMSDG